MCSDLNDFHNAETHRGRGNPAAWVKPSSRRRAPRARAGLVIAITLAASLTACGGDAHNGAPSPKQAAKPTPSAQPAIWVVDDGNNRTLGYSAPINTIGQLANVVLGEPNFTETNCQTGTIASAQCQSNPFASAAVDSSGNLWVTDLGNNRVLKYSPPFSNGQAATLVIGQPNFTSTTSGSGQNQLDQPIYVAFDRGGDLWVSDSINNRVLEYLKPFSNGMNPSVVIGQPDFSSTACVNGTNDATDSTICSPWGIAFDSSNNMFLADNGNSRILEFKPPFTTGMSASFVIGQPNFTSNAAPINPTASLVGPFGIAVDGGGNIWAADVNYGRVIEFPPPTANGEAAIRELGEPSMTTYDAQCPNSAGHPTASLICEAFDVKVDASGNVYAVDNDNNRLLVWDAPITADGQAANFVVGQTSFTANGFATGTGGLDLPAGIALGVSLQP